MSGTTDGAVASHEARKGPGCSSMFGENAMEEAQDAVHYKSDSMREVDVEGQDGAGDVDKKEFEAAEVKSR